MSDDASRVILDAISKLFVFDKDPRSGELIVVVFNGISRVTLTTPTSPIPMSRYLATRNTKRRGAPPRRPHQRRTDGLARDNGQSPKGSRPCETQLVTF
jgi:hypothetical protein